MNNDTPEPTIIDRLQQLSEVTGMAGNEGAVRKLVLEMIDGHADSVDVDTMGNVFARKNGSGEQPTHVMAAAHMDEVGVMIVAIDDGLCRFEAVGGLDPRVLIGKPMWVGVDKLAGVILAKPIHLLKRNARDSVPDISGLRIDVGPNGGKVSPGDWATFAMPFANLGPTLRGKALDDRVGVAILIELLRGDRFPFDFTAAFTVQEEIGLRGARVAAYRIDPDVAIVLEATPAHDLPMPDEEDENIHYNTRLNHGPALSTADRSTLHSRRLSAHFAGVAEAGQIPFQYRQPGGGGNDAGAIHKARGGIPSLGISVPARYIHSPAALISVSDLENTVKLVRAGLNALTPDVYQRR